MKNISISPATDGCHAFKSPSSEIKKPKNMKTLLHKSLICAIAFVMVNLFFVSGAWATTYYLTTTGQGTAGTAGNWNTGGIGGGGTAATIFTNSSDIFVISTGITASFIVDNSITIFDGTLQVDGSIVIGTGTNNSKATVQVNGTLLFNSSGNQVTFGTSGGNGDNYIILGVSGILKTKNTSGILGTNCSILLNGARTHATLPTTANYEFNGTDNQATVGLPATVNNLTINNTGASTKTVTLGQGTTVSSNITLTSGILDVSTSNFALNVGGNWTNSGGTFIPRSGTVSFTASTAVTQTLSGNTTFYNISKTNAISTLAFGSTNTTIGGNLSINAGSMNGGTSTIIFTGASGAISGNGAKNFKNLHINNGASISTSGNGNISIDGSYTNNGTFVQTSTLTTSFAGIQILSGTGSSTFGSVTVQGGSTVNSGTHNFTVGGTFSVSSTGTFNGGTATVNFSGTTTMGSGTGTYNFNNLTIGSGTLSNTNNKPFNVSGNWINNGTYTKGTETVTFNGSGIKTIGGASTTTFNNITIATGASVNLSPTTSATCNNLTVASGATLTIESSASETGSLIVNGTSSGNVASQHYLTDHIWHMISPTVTGSSISSFIQDAGNAIPKNVSEYAMMDYNESTNVWSDYFTPLTGGNLSAGKGYGLTRDGAGIVTFTGTLPTGTKTVTLSKSGYGWNCIGNPYTSAIYMNDDIETANNFITVNKDFLESSYANVYVWDDALNGYKILGNSGYGTLGMNIFQSGQGFFVKALNNGVSVKFTKNMQVHSNAILLKSTKISWPGFELMATSANETVSTVVTFNNAMTKGLDPTYDAGLFRGSTAINIYTRLLEDNGIDFAIQCLPEMYSNLVIPVGVESKTGGEITLSAKSVGLPESCRIILEDKTTGTFTSLANGATYKAVVAAGASGTGRFFIHTNELVSGVTTLPDTFNMKAYQLKGLIYIIGEVGNSARVSLFDINGRELGAYNLLKSNMNSISAEGLNPGVYLLRISDGAKRNVIKVVIN